MKDVSLRHVLVTCLSGILLWTLGCGETPPGENVPLKTVQNECRTFKSDKLKERARTYLDLMTESGQRLIDLDKKLATMDPEVVDKSEIEALKAEREQLTKTRGVLAQRYGLYIKTLVRRKVDVTELRMPDNSTTPPATNVPE